jgi:hypothetical protein
VKLYSKDICEEPKIDLNLFSSNNHEQTYEPRVANLTGLDRTHVVLPQQTLSAGIEGRNRGIPEWKFQG